MPTSPLWRFHGLFASLTPFPMKPAKLYTQIQSPALKSYAKRLLKSHGLQSPFLGPTSFEAVLLDGFPMVDFHLATDLYISLEDT
jgi:hypothetical protein